MVSTEVSEAAGLNRTRPNEKLEENEEAALSMAISYPGTESGKIPTSAK